MARVADEVPALTVFPSTKHQQTRQAALLVAHLDPGQLPDPAADVRRLSAGPQDEPDESQQPIP